MKIKEKIFNEIHPNKPFTFDFIKDIVKEGDIILSGFDEGFYSENNSMDGHYYMKVIREREETEEEKQKRLDKAKIEEKRDKERRYKSYLRLKEEFENER